SSNCALDARLGQIQPGSQFGILQVAVTSQVALDAVDNVELAIGGELTRKASHHVKQGPCPFPQKDALRCLRMPRFSRIIRFTGFKVERKWRHSSAALLRSFSVGCVGKEVLDRLE